MSKLKRLAVPKFWPIERKTKKYAVMPSAGPHSSKRCIPLGIVLRDILRFAESMKEAKELLNKGIVSIDGRPRRTQNFPVGFMDVVSIGDGYYRALIGDHGLYLHKIENKEASIKLCRIENKNYLKNGRLQLNLHDGKNILSDKEYSTGDVLVLNLPDLSIKEVLRLEKKSVALVIAGHNKGRIGKIMDMKKTRTSQPNQTLVSLEDRSVSIPRDFVFVLGKEKPVISFR